MAAHLDTLDLALMVSTLGGIRWFFRGFRVYRRYLRVEGTPTVPIRSIAMGPVRIHGKASKESPIASPVSHTPCCFYTVTIRKWHDEGDNGRWMHYGTDSGGDRFYVEDASGRVLVAPQGAECDIERTAQCETGADAQLLAYVACIGASPEQPGQSPHNLELERAFLAPSQRRIQATTPDEMMQKLLPGVVEGEAKILSALEAEGPQADPLREQLRLAQIELHKHPIWSPEYASSFQRVTKLQAQVKKSGPAIAIAEPNPPPDPDPAPTARGRYMLTERCVLPGSEYDITGTCALNPEAKGASDRNLIRKGTLDTAFLISGLTRPQVNKMLQFRAKSMIFGGGMLGVFSLTLLLLRLGQF